MENLSVDCYVLKSLQSDKILKNSSTVSYINLSTLREEDSTAGILAKYLLNPKEKSEDIRELIDLMEEHLRVMKEDDKMVGSLAKEELDKMAERAEGIEIGMEKGVYNLMKKKVERGLNMDEICRDLEIDKEYAILLIEKFKEQ